MKDLLPHFESELAQLRRSSEHFGRLYPKIASRLMLGADVAEDPHVERLIQSFALLAARVHKRLDDDFPLITESLLEVLYPHYLRPFPSCSIAQFDFNETLTQLAQKNCIARHTNLESMPLRGGVKCKFRTVCDVQLLPLAVKAAHYRHSASAPVGSPRLPPNSAGVLSIKLELLSAQVSWVDMPSKLRVYLDGEPSQVSALREALCNNVVSFLCQIQDHHPWRGPYVKPVEMVGFAHEEALIDYDERSHSAYRLLTEYFVFPEKFNFVDIPMPDNLADAKSRTLTLHFVLSGLRSDSDSTRLLENTNAENFALGCTPVINLFEQNSEPILLTQTTTQYPVVLSSTQASSFEIYSIDNVNRITADEKSEVIGEIKPFFSLHHDDLLNAEGGPREVRAPAHYWHVQRDEQVALNSPGYELLLSIVDSQFNPSNALREALSLNVKATNRNLPSRQLTFKTAGGDLFMQGGNTMHGARLLKKPTPTYSFERGRGNLWHLVSHLSLNHLSLSGRGIDSLKEMLLLYNLTADAANRQQIEALVSIKFVPATAWLQGEPFASFVRGTEVRLSVNEDNFVGTGLSLFTAVLDRFFGLYVHINSFTQLTVLSARTEKILIQCPPRNGAKALV
jgi:type VI secretion system protein ImpG